MPGTSSLTQAPPELLGRDGPPSAEELPLRAKFFLLALGAVTAAAVLPLLSRPEPERNEWLYFAVLAICAAVAQLFVVITPRNQSYHPTPVFLIPAALLLPPELIVLVAVIQHIPEWLKLRYRWYIQTFNILNYALSMLAAWGAAQLVYRFDAVAGEPALRVALGGLAASIALVGLNHTLLSTMLKLGRAHSFRESGLFTLDSLVTDLVLAALGVGVAALWTVNAVLIPFVLAPLVLIQRSLELPALQEEARVDAKTGLFNVRHFSIAVRAELERAQRFERPLSLIMADLDLLRDVNNTYGHLAGDAVLRKVAQVFRSQLRNQDIPARFGGEEFAIVLPETAPEHARLIADRIRRAIAECQISIPNSRRTIGVTVSIGIASFPDHADDVTALIHQADLAVYRAKLQGRNRVLVASSEPLLLPAEEMVSFVTVPEDGEHVTPLPAAQPVRPREERRQTPRPTARPKRTGVRRRLTALVAFTGLAGVLGGVLGLALGAPPDVVALLAIVGLVGVGQALAIEVVDQGSLSVSAVGALAGAALVGPKAALAVAVTTCAVDWSARRTPVYHTIFNLGAVSLSSLAAAAVFAGAGDGKAFLAVAGLVAGAAYFAVNMGLLSVALALETGERWWQMFRDRVAWLAPHYLGYGFVGAVIAIAYDAAGVYAVGVFAVPLLLMRRTQASYLDKTERSAKQLREAAETIQGQNVSLERANRMLRERSTAAMASLSATVDVRDTHTAGHARRVQQLALAIGRELSLSQPELDLLGHAALFHDIGKLAIPDSILLKPASLTNEEWHLMRRHSDEGARMIDRLGFLRDAVPAIRHHHERWDGGGYPDGLVGEEIPLGARIIHVADAIDSMITDRSYREAVPPAAALAEIRRLAGSQFCPRCVVAAERMFPYTIGRSEETPQRLAAAS